jgi:folate-binding protein YgfZ
MVMPSDPTISDRHAAVCAAGGVLRTDARGIIEVRGADRATWLHNLLTNVVATLRPGDGNYAFATNVQGRTIFDLNVLVFEDRLWLDIDRRWIAAALAHLNKYIIVEDVTLRDISADWSRWVMLGPATARAVEALSLGNNFDALADVQHVSAEFEGGALLLVKNNLGPIRGAEFHVPIAQADAFAALLAERGRALGIQSIDEALFHMIRVEAGVPASVDDIDDQVIPPETLQVERGICYVKGCYLGQEVLERMRSRGSMARKLTAFQIAGDAAPERNAPIFADGKEIGRVTSVCDSVALGSIMALGYARTVVAAPGDVVQVAISEHDTTTATAIEAPLPLHTKRP